MVTMPTQRNKIDATNLDLSEKVVYTRRVTKVVSGGRNRRFNALVVVGDGEGKVGVGMGKAIAIPDAVKKGNAIARRNLIEIPLKGSTLPHESRATRGAALILLKPAPPGTGIIAAGGVRAVLELAGVKDVVTKSLKSRNPINVVQATIAALKNIRDPIQERAERQNAAIVRTQYGEPSR